MKKATIEDVPDWFWAAEIYQKELSLAEWAEELNARVFLMHLSLDSEFGLDSMKKSSDFLNSHFVDFAIQGERGERNSAALQQLPPISGLDYEQVDYRYIKVFEHRLDAAQHSFPYPLLINLNYSKQSLMEEFEKYLDRLIEGFDFDAWNKNNLEYFTKRLCCGVEKRVFTNLGKQYSGYTSYTEKNAKQWYEYCVLEYIDLFFWGLLNDLDYSETLLASIFWHQDLKRSFKYSYQKDHLKIKRTVRPWACELLNRRTIARIRASST